MRCRRRARVAAALVGVGLASGLVGASRADPPLAWPTTTSPSLTSTFGEYRRGYFHSGIDLSTGGRVGVPLHAIGDGEIVRVRASGVGYGRAIYLRVDDGPMAVFAHLDRFMPELDAYVRAAQHRLGRYEVDLYPDDGTFRVSTGDVIGATGDTGAGPPHLHFELRNALGDVAINPLRFGYDPADDVAPTIADVRIEPAAPRTRVDGEFSSVVRTVSRGLVPDTTRVTGPFRLSTHVFDRAGRGTARLAVHALELRTDRLLYASRLDTVPYANQRVVDLVYDPERASMGETRVRRLYVAPGSALADAHTAGDGVVGVDAGAGDLVICEVRAVDFAGNETRVRVPVLVDPTPAGLPASPDRREDPPDAAVPVATPSAGGGVDRWRSSVRGSVDRAHVVLEVERAIGSLDRARVTLAGRTEIPSVFCDDSHRIDLVFAPFGSGPAEVAIAGTYADGSGFEETLPIDAVFVDPDASEPTTLARDGVTVTVEPGDLFASGWLRATVGERPELSDGLVPRSRIVALEPREQVFARPVTVRLVPDPAPADVAAVAGVAGTPAQGLGIYALDEKTGSWAFEGGEWDGEALAVETRRIGRFCVALDRVAPVVEAVRPADGARVSAGAPVGATVSDVGSGLHWTGLTLEIDGEPVIAEWAPDVGVCRARTGTPLSKGEHVARLIAVDRCLNRTERTWTFTVTGP